MANLEKLGANTLDHGLENTESNFRGNLVLGKLEIWAVNPHFETLKGKLTEISPLSWS